MLGFMTDTRKIIHVDCDCFYAAVEMRDNPSLYQQPIAVGGLGKRGVLATCNYQARKFGIRSAMPTGYALRLCPDLIVLPPRFSAYKEASAQIMSIFSEYSDDVEPLSLDEAFIDVTHSSKFKGSATLMAQEIKEKVYKQVGITVSAGVAGNKFLAKIASDWNKPDGLFVVTPDQAPAFVAALPVEKVHGVGKATATRLHQRGLYSCHDIVDHGLKPMLDEFGLFGKQLYQLSQGIDDRPVRISRQRKSISVERTFSEDIESLNGCQKKIESVFEELETRIGRLESGVRFCKLYVKMKFLDFTQTTVETSGSSAEFEQFKNLLNQAWFRQKKPVRLLGLGLKIRHDDDIEQLELFS